MLQTILVSLLRLPLSRKMKNQLTRLLGSTGRMERDGTVSVPWTFAAFPSEDFKNYFGDVLLEYVQGTKT